jgi:hypothetical protein
MMQGEDKNMVELVRKLSLSPSVNRRKLNPHASNDDLE